MEDLLAERGAACSEQDRDALRETWSRLEQRLGCLLEGSPEDSISVARSTYEEAIQLAEGGAEGASLARELRQWEWDLVSTQLERLADRTRSLAERLDKGEIVVEVSSPAIRQPRSEAWSAFWGSLVHLARNALDHGIEAPGERAESHKPETARVGLRAFRSGDELVVEISDDGRGIDWERIAEKARAANLPADTQPQRVAALFADGVSSRDTVSEISGRGVGTSAVWEACEQLGGRVEVESARGDGTCFRFTLPLGAEAGVESGHQVAS